MPVKGLAHCADNHWVLLSPSTKPHTVLFATKQACEAKLAELSSQKPALTDLQCMTAKEVQESMKSTATNVFVEMR
jgi:hypothetical protein